MTATQMMLLGGSQAAIVVTNIGAATSNGASATCTITPGSNIPVGAMVFVFVQEYQQAANLAAPQTVVDSGSNTYACDVSAINVGGVSSVMLFSSKLTTPVSSAGSITYNLKNGGNYAIITAMYATVVGTYDSATGATTNNTAGTPGAVTSGTPTQGGELFLEFAGWWDSSSSPVFVTDTGNGWTGNPPPTTTNVAVPGSRWAAVGGAYQVNTGTGTKQGNGTLTSPVGGIRLVAGYKP